MKWRSFYEILNVRNCATIEEVRRAYGEVKESLTSDHLTYFLMSENEKREIMTQVELAYEILTDEVSKRLYDEYLIKTRRGFVRVEMGRASEREQKQPEHPGEVFKFKREEKGLAIEDVYQATRISADVIKAMESMNMEKLPEWVYLKGLLRQYARFLGINEAEIVEAFSRYLAEKVR